MTSIKPGVIRGVVVAVGGRPVEGARVFFRSGPQPLPDIAALTGGDGTFALAAPAAGTYEVAAVDDAAGSASTTVVVTEGSTVTVTMWLGERG